jgi:hypothetical protein
MSLTLNLDKSTENKLFIQAKNQGLNINDYVLQIIQQKIADTTTVTHLPVLSAIETELYMQINQGFAEISWDRLRELIAKRENYSLSDEELEELISMTQETERLNSNRLRALLSLSELRNTTIEKLMEELEIHPISL